MSGMTRIWKTQNNITWYILKFFAIRMITVRVECSEWNGCVCSHLMKGDLCYKIQPPMSGEEAWKNCTTLYLPNVYRKNATAEALRKTLRRPETKQPGRGRSEGTNGQPVWVGSIQPYPGTKNYESYYNEMHAVHEEPHDGTQGCLAVEPLQSGSFFPVRHSCDEKLHVLCIVHVRNMTMVFNASAPESCNDTSAVSMSILPGCFIPTHLSCPGYFVRVRPAYFLKSLKEHVVSMYSPQDMYVIEFNTNQGRFRKKNMTDENSTLYCLVERETTQELQLQLRRNFVNRTAGGLALWVSAPGRVAEWPPRCVGGDVAKRRRGTEETHTLHIIRRKGPEATPVVWCYALDIITGGIVVSNRILFFPKETSKSCPDRNSSAGPPLGTTVNHKASCLHCLEKAIRSGAEDKMPNTTCTEMRCGPFNLKYSLWKTIYNNKSFADFRRCVESRQCAGNVIWDLTEGRDNNKDGVVDCEDRFSLFISLFKSVTDADPRNIIESENYWKCRSQQNADFVDINTENGTARYYCLNDLFKGRHWSKPKFISREESYNSVTDPVETVITTEIPNLLETKTMQELSNLQHISVNLSKNATLTINQTQEIIQNFSRIYDVSDQVLRKSQHEANVTSLPELLETILIKAPDNVNSTTPNLAVTKKHAIGFQLISDEPITNLESFGDHPKQIEILSSDDIIRKKVEAAVIFPNISENITMMMITFAKGHDFISGQRHEKDSTNNFTVQANDSSIEESHSPNTVKQEECEFGGKCQNDKNILRGCRNTHVVKIALLNKSGSYVPLPQGQTVDILLRTKVSPMIGQTKHCVRWIPEEGEWSPDGCQLVKEEDGLDTCRCSYLTHFAQLVTDGDAVHGPHERILNMFTLCACGTSLLGLAGVIIAGVFLKKWRRKNENKVLTNLAVAMALYIGLFLRSALMPNIIPVSHNCTTPEAPSIICQITGAALHYFLLSSFCWMLVAATTHCLRLTTFTGTSTISHFVLKASLVGWGVPLVPVAVLMTVNAETYNGRGRDFCYPTGVAFYGAVLAPILLVLLINMVMFLIILKTIFPLCCKINKVDIQRHEFGRKNSLKIHIRKLVVCVAFTFLFGLTWYLGLMSFTVIPAYVFCVVMGLQGPALLVFFVLGEERIRNKLKTMSEKLWSSDSRWSGSTSSTAVFSVPLQPRNRWQSPSRMHERTKGVDSDKREFNNEEMRSDLRY